MPSWLVSYVASGPVVTVTVSPAMLKMSMSAMRIVKHTTSTYLIALCRLQRGSLAMLVVVLVVNCEFQR